jgi:hypothetical protein
LIGSGLPCDVSQASQPQDAVVSASSLPDSILHLDTLSGDTIDRPDSAMYPDTLTDAQRQLMEFEERYRQFQEEKKSERQEQFSYIDTLLQYFTSSRLNQRELIDRSYYRDPGDYFKFDPNYFILDHQATPMRKTVQPFGLSGDRLNFIHNGWPIHPFEHIPEPDGLVDLNDLPSALDYDVYLLPGPIGRMFGGHSSVATLLAQPKHPDGFEPESAFLVDKGSLAYSHARGRYSKRFTQGREIDMSLGYRKSEGVLLSSFEDSYQYFGELYSPVYQQTALRVTGHLYNRDGRLAIRPDFAGILQARDRFDRSLRIAFARHNADYSARYEAGYTHLRQASYLTQRYKANFDQTGHGAYISQEWVSGNKVFKTTADVGYREYAYGDNELAIRRSGSVSASMASLGQNYRYALQLDQAFIRNSSSATGATAVIQRETGNLFVLMSFGYSERPPSLHELYLPFQEASIYGSSNDYADHGNHDLQEEKQLIGSATMLIGQQDNDINLQVTGGKIMDGIDWKYVVENGQTVFSPVNGDITFVSASAGKTLRIADFLRFCGGGAYHYLDYEEFDNKAYAPEYQFFSGLELHLFWSQKLIDLYAYGEIVYTGPYDGYKKQGLGQEPVANAKLSFRMGSFRFHYIFQNVLSRVYEVREDFSYPGRYNSWGFIWTFLN